MPLAFSNGRRLGDAVPVRRLVRGFTLVELLVVIGIIALLISILLPALSKARTSALRAQCLSNLHSLALAMDMYLVQSKGTFPGHKESLTAVGPAPANAPQPYWADDILGDDVSGSGASMVLTTKNPKQLNCPAQGSGLSGDYYQAWSFANDANHISYGYNAFFLGFYVYSDGTAASNFVAPEYGYSTPLPPQRWMKTNEVKDPTQCLMFADSSPPYTFSLWWPRACMTKGAGNEGVSCMRHGNISGPAGAKSGVGMVVFVDGHGEMRSDKSINPQTDPDLTGDLRNSKWWDPLQRNLTVP